MSQIVVAMALALSLAACQGPLPSPPSMPAQPAEVPLKVTACQLLSDPPTYNHKLVEVSGTVSSGFEDFGLYPDDCAAKGMPMVWLDLGGATDSGTIYCCGDHHRNKPILVEGIEVPLIDDAKTRRFVKAIQSGQPASGPTTLIGRFFSGQLAKMPAGMFWMGYGHMGCCTLLVVQQVLD